VREIEKSKSNDIDMTLHSFEETLIYESHERLAMLIPFMLIVEAAMLAITFYVRDAAEIKWINGLFFIYSTLIYLAINIVDTADVDFPSKFRIMAALQMVTTAGVLLWGSSMLGYKSHSAVSYFDFVIALFITGVIIRQKITRWGIYYIAVLTYLYFLTPFERTLADDVFLTWMSLFLFICTALYVNWLLYRQAGETYQVESELKYQKKMLESLVEIKTSELIKTEKSMTREVAMLLTVVMEYYDEYTKGHSENVAQISESLARAVGIDLERQKEIFWAGMVHDIGKIRVDKAILNKETPLTRDEFEQIKNHSLYGYEMTSNLESLKRISKIVRHHHEHFDGTGYPDGLSGDEIPLEAQIIAIADAWDAMRSDRVYRKSLSVESARLELIKNSGSQFSPKCVAAFLDLECANK